MGSDLVLSKIDGARKLLSEAKTIQEAKHISDIAEAARVYAKRVTSSIETVNYAAEVKVRAERLLGEMLAQTPKQDGGDAMKARFHKGTEVPATLAEIGIDKKTSMRSQQLASVPVPGNGNGSTRFRLTASRRCRLIARKVGHGFLRDKTAYQATRRARPARACHLAEWASR